MFLQHVDSIMAMVTAFYPAPGSSADYCNRPDIYDNTAARQSELLPPSVMARLQSTGRVPRAGDVKYVFVTKSGPGPVRQPLEESLLDPATGDLVEPGPRHKRMRIGEA